jgi:hypothetical protein
MYPLRNVQNSCKTYAYTTKTCIDANFHTALALLYCAYDCMHATQPLPKKLLTAWRPITSRLQLLTALVREFGIDNSSGSSSGLSSDAVMGFIKVSTCYITM